MKKSIVVAVLMLSTLGCTNQKEVDALRQQIADLKAQQEQREKSGELKADKLRDALDVADTDLTACRVDAEVVLNKQWKANSTKGTGDLRLWDAFTAQQRRANEDCQRSYENAVQRAKILYGGNQ